MWGTLSFAVNDQVSWGGKDNQTVLADQEAHEDPPGKGGKST